MSQSTAIPKDPASTIHTERENYWFAALERRASCLPHTLSLTDTAKDSALAWEEEIMALRSLVASAQTRRNAFVPACSLPPEILSRIFTYVKIYSIQLATASWASFHDSNRFRWLVITQVCKNWRNVAIGHSALWAEISNEPTHKLPWDTFLQRARSYPLSIVATVPGGLQGTGSALSTADTEHLRLIIEHLPHIRDLRLTTHASEALTLISSTTPVLGLLILHLRLISYQTPIILPSSFFQSASALQEITLDGFLFPWDAALPNLRTLTIRYDIRTINSHSNPSLTDHLPCDTDRILRCLQHMPRLEELSLSCLSIPTLLSSSVEAVLLPHLKRLSLTGAPQACFDLWRSIQPHPHANIFILASSATVGMQDPQIEEAQMQDALSTLSRHLTSPDSLIFTEVSIFGYGNLADRIIMEAALPPDIAGTEGGGRQQTQIELNLKHSSRSALVALCAKIPLHHIEELGVYSMNSLSVDDWSLLLSAARSVKKITLSEMPSGPLEAFCSVMTPAGIPSKKTEGRSQQEALKRQAPVPRLAYLEFGYINFFENNSTDMRPIASCLERMLKARKGAQCALQALTFDECYIRGIQVDRLEQIVPEVEWDGDPEPSEDGDSDGEYYDSYDDYGYGLDIEDHYLGFY